MIRFAKSAAIPTDVPWYELDRRQQELPLGGPRRLPRYPRILRRAGPQEVQAPRPRLPLQVPRLRALPRLPRPAPPRRGPRRPHRVATARKNICEISALTISGAADSSTIYNSRRHKWRSPARSSKRSASASTSSTGRPRLPHPRPPLLHALRRRIAAHPTRHLARLAPRRSALRARRALHRPAHPRHRQAHPHPLLPPRPRQHHPRRRARPRRHPRRRLSPRPRPRRRRTRRPVAGRRKRR